MPDKAVKLCINQDYIEVQHDNNKHYITLNASTRLVVRNIESKYPNWQQFVPQAFKHEIQGNTKDFTSLIKKAEKLADKKSKSIAFDENKLRVNPDLTLDLGNIKNTMLDDKTFNPKIGINASYLLDALTCVDQDNVSIKMNDSLSPVRISSQSFEAVIMPMRV
jgi:DNA polymerase-3 subunit beta